MVLKPYPWELRNYLQQKLLDCTSLVSSHCPLIYQRNGWNILKRNAGKSWHSHKLYLFGSRY